MTLLLLLFSSANTWKLSTKIQGWSWNTTHLGSYPNNTYLSMGIQIGFDSNKNMSLNFRQNTRAYTVTAGFGNANLELTMDYGVLLNGQPSLGTYVSSFPNISFQEDMRFFAVDGPLHFCEPTPNETTILRKWDTLYNDPSVQVIFTDFDPRVPLSPEAQKSRTTVIIVASVVTILVVLIVTTIVLLFIFKPKVTVFSSSHPKEHKESLQPRREATDGDSWLPASKPLD